MTPRHVYRWLAVIPALWLALRAACAEVVVVDATGGAAAARVRRLAEELHALGEAARVDPPPAACAAGPGPACERYAAEVVFTPHVVAVAALEGEPPPGVHAAGDCPTRRLLCHVGGGPARSLLDLDANVAYQYADAQALPQRNGSEGACAAGGCADVWVSAGAEAALQDAARAHRLRMRVRRLLDAGKGVNINKGVICEWMTAGSRVPVGRRALAPPVCTLPKGCAFEPRRVTLLSDPGGAHEWRDRLRRAWSGACDRGREPVRGNTLTLLLLPAAPAARPAARLAAKCAAIRSDQANNVRFNVRTSVEEGAASTLVGLNCQNQTIPTATAAVAAVAGGAAWSDVSGLCAELGVPLLAWGRAAVGGRGQVVPAGGAARLAAATAALLLRYGWRRAAVLADRATAPVLNATMLGVTIVEHLVLDVETPNRKHQIEQWVERAALGGARVMVVGVDGAAGVAALCAGARVGLTALAGATWLLLAEPDADVCTAAVDGALALQPAWLADYKPPPRAPCPRAPYDPPVNFTHDPQAALLYDTLRQWFSAQYHLMQASPNNLFKLNDHNVTRWLINNMTGGEYKGLTGSWRWEEAGGAWYRGGDVVLQQLEAGGRRVELDRWRGGAGGGWAGGREPRWRTAGGAVPDDGAPCALPALAGALGSCSGAVAVAALLALAAVALVLALPAAALMRRAAHKHAARGTAAVVAASLDRWELPPERLVINRKIGVGAFGNVYGGHAKLDEASSDWTAVAVKALRSGATVEEKLDFLAEAELMKRFQHENLVGLLGVVTQAEPVRCVMEFMLYGDLKSYLQARRGLAGGSEDDVSPRRLTRMARDAARALCYLARAHYVHRDVAARNCLVSAQRQLKLGDFGMARMVYDAEYYRLRRHCRLPVRWMAPESLTSGVFTPASDVWSFGVLLYEMVTFGALPYHGLSNADVLARVKSGRALDMPRGLPPQLEGLMKSCWQMDSKERPSAVELAVYLAQAPELLRPALQPPVDVLPLGAPSTADTYLSRTPPTGSLPDDAEPFLPTPPRSPPSPSLLSRHL